jgi:predicted alpha/beta-hydrolase family hydrolase
VSCEGALPSNELLVRVNRDTTVTSLVYGAWDPRPGGALILAHGAGAGQRSPFMTSFAQAIAVLGFDVVTFDFPYVEQRRRVPDRRPLLEACYAAVIQSVRAEVDSAARALFIGGKSMGGRIATHVAAAGLAANPKGVVLLGYPLHPPGKPDQRRDSHLPDVRCPMLFVQGSRDAFGTPGELEPVLATLAQPATLHVVANGDHSFKVTSDARRQREVFDGVQRAIVDWIRRINGQAPSETLLPHR